MFRIRNDRCYYFFGVEGDRAVLKIVQHETSFRPPFEKILATQALTWTPGENLRLRIQVNGAHIVASINGRQIADLQDSTYAFGHIGLTSDIPSRFSSVHVSMTAAEKQMLDARISASHLRQCCRAVQSEPARTTRGVGRAMIAGRLSKASTCAVLTGHVLKQALGLPLSEHENEVEAASTNGRT